MWSKILQWKTVKEAVSILLVFFLTGCRNIYEMNIYSKPLGAHVKIGSTVYGDTPCKIEIPSDSEEIKNHEIDITYSLDDGRSMTKTYDLRMYKKPSKIVTIIGGTIAGTGALGLALTATDKDDEYTSFDEDDSTETERNVQLCSLGLLGLGLLVCYIFGGDLSPEAYDVYETFDDANDLPVN